jgi:microcystin-dependent protein
MARIRIDTASKIAVKTGEKVTIDLLSGYTATEALEIFDSLNSKVAAISPTGKLTVSNIPDNSITLGTDTTGSYIETIVNGTGVTVLGGTGEGSTATISIDQDVATSANVEFNSIQINGNLTVDDLEVFGGTFTSSASAVSLDDNIILLNRNVTTTPTNAGIEIERGTSNNVYFRWNESLDKWQITNNGTTYISLVASASSLAGLDNVQITSPTLGDVLKYDTGASKWINGPAPTGAVVIGQIMQWHSTTIPSGWLLCNGSSLNSYTYKELHAVISNNYGGDAFVLGVTDQVGASASFNIPDFDGFVAKGVSSSPFAPSNISVEVQTSAHTHNVTSNSSGAHAHTFSTPLSGEHTHTVNVANAGHSHGGSYSDGSMLHGHPSPAIGSNNVSADHTHTINTFNMPDTPWSHSHSYNTNPVVGFLQSNGDPHAHSANTNLGSNTAPGHNISMSAFSVSHSHGSNFGSATSSIDHSHNVSSGSVTGDPSNHNHSITSNAAENAPHSHNITVSNDSGHAHDVESVSQIFIIRYSE